MNLSIKPNLCLIRQPESYCPETLDIRWKSTKNFALCLYREDQDEALYCWSSRREGSWQLATEIRTTTLFVLRDTTNQMQVASKEFSVLLRDKQERRRNPWSFF